jgi:hypothetical protein
MMMVAKEVALEDYHHLIQYKGKDIEQTIGNNSFLFK